MRVVVNGSTQALPDDACLAAVVATVTDRRSGVAVAVNDVVVRQADWPTTPVHDADRIDVLSAVQGG